jgi:FAD/FMN-containing dehydrogenase
MKAGHHTTGLAASAAAETKADAHQPIFQDWARFVSFRPQLYFRPQDISELRSLLTAMQQGILKPRTPRVLGGLHSCSDICVSDATVDVSDLPKTIEFDADNTIVTVSANWHLHDFLLALSERGKSLSATGGTDAQTLAGLISTNTAPATPRHGIYELLEWVEYVTIDQDSQSVIEKRVSRTDPAFRAVVGSLGAIGVLTRVQFKVIDEPYFETIQKIVKLREVLADVAQTSQKYDFWRIDWIPDTDEGLLWAATRIPHADPNGDYPSDRAQNIMEYVFTLLDRRESAGPLLDTAMRLIYGGLTMTYGETQVSGPLRNMLPVDRRTPLHVAMAEWSFDPTDLNNLMERCREYYERKGWPNLPIEIELTKTDDYLMSPWNWQGLDYIVKFNFMYLTDISQTESEKEQIRAHLRGLWDHLVQAGIRFKAHWGKINFMDHAFVEDHYEFEQFRPFICPMFLNKYLTDRFEATSPRQAGPVEGVALP